MKRFGGSFALGCATVFVSGFCVMLVELAFGRLMAPYFGQSAYTWTAVTAATLAGLATGNFAGGALAARLGGWRTAALGLVLGGAWCLLLPLLNRVSGTTLSGAVEQAWALRIVAHTALTLFGVMAALGMVTPGVAHACVRARDPGRSVGLLYGWVMAGSLAGSLLTGLWLPFRFPVTHLTLAAGAVLLAAGVLLLAAGSGLTAAATESRAVAGDAGRVPLRLAAVVFGVAFAAMGAEMAAIKVLTPVTGSSYVVWSLLFGVFICGMALGGYLGGRVADAWPRREVLAGTLLAGALAIPLAAWFNDWAARVVWVSGLPWILGLLATVTIAFLPLAALFGCLSTMVLRAALADPVTGGVRRGKIGLCYGLASVGNVAGTLVAGFFLVGVVRTPVILAGLACLLTGCAALTAPSGPLLRRAVLGLAGLFAVMLVSGGNGFFPDTRPVEAHALGARCFDAESLYGRVSVYDTPGQPAKKTLLLDRVPHSVVDCRDPKNLMAIYTRLIACAADVQRRGKGKPDVCVIGGGGYALPRYFRDAGAGRVSVIEIDPAVTEAAVAVCGLNVSAIENINADGRIAVDDLLTRGRAAGGFDLVIGDTINDAAIPYHLITREFTDKVKALLRPGGAYLLHIVDERDAGLLLGSVVKTLACSFGHVAVLTATGIAETRQSYAVVASDGPVPVEAMREEVVRRYPDYEGLSLGEEAAAALAGRNGTLVFEDRFAPVEKFVLGSLLNGAAYQVAKWLNKARAAWEAKAYGRAEAYAQRVLAKQPDNEDALGMIGQLYARDPAGGERYLAQLRQAAGRPTGEAMSRHLYAQALMATGAFEQAGAVWDALWVRYPQMEGYGYFASQAYASAGKLREACERAERAAQSSAVGGALQAWADEMRSRVARERKAAGGSGGK